MGQQAPAGQHPPYEGCTLRSAAPKCKWATRGLRAYTHTYMHTFILSLTHTHNTHACHLRTVCTRASAFFSFPAKPTLSTGPGLGHAEDTCFNTSGTEGQARREACGLPANARCAPHTELHGLATRCKGFRCKPTECFIVWPIKHCHHSLQPIEPTHFARNPAPMASG